MLHDSYGGPSAVVGIVVLLVLNALLNAAEAALGALRAHHVRFVRETDPRRAARLQRLLDAREAGIAACGLARRLARVALVVLVLMLAPSVGAWIDRRAEGFTYGEALLGALVLALPIALLNFVIGEIVPHAYGGGHPTVVLTRLGRLVRSVSALLVVPARAIVRLSEALNLRFGGADADGTNPLEEEIKTLAESAEVTGQIESDERELIHSVFEFADTVAREIMTPRVNLDSIPVKSDPQDVANLIETTGHSRIPLYEDTDDNILGFVHAKDLLGALALGRAVDLRRLLRPVLKVPEGKGVRDLLAEMRAARTQMAVVQDEFGGTAGVVTVEDIVEELVGDIMDEYDPEETEVVPLEDGWLIEGMTHLDDMNDLIGSDFESEEFDTVGGFVFGQFGRQPKPGESIDIELYRFTVTETDGRRVGQLRVERCGAPSLDGLDEA